MEKHEVGKLARSMAGHDAGHIYVIIDMDSTYVYLADGRIRTLQRPKKKKKKHVQVICRKYGLLGADDVAIKRILKMSRRDGYGIYLHGNEN